jgi:hypothetical protein
VTLDFRPLFLSSPMSKIINQLKHLSTFASRQSFPRQWVLPYDFRLSTLGLLLTFSLLTIQCGLDVEDPTPPSPPVWVQKSLPEEWPECGIDAHESGGIILEWDPSPEDNIVRYLIFSAQYYDENDSLGDYEVLGSNTPETTIRLNFLDSEAATQVKYYYKLKAEDLAGNLSVFSDSVGYTLLRSLNHETMSPNGNSDTLNDSRSLTWRYTYDIEMENYCLTILSQNDSFVSRVVISPTDYLNGIESWSIPEAVALDSNKIYKWRIDVGAQYENNVETSGSESVWATFLYYQE